MIKTKYTIYYDFKLSIPKPRNRIDKQDAFQNRWDC